MASPRVVLASTSRYRAELLHRIIDDFAQAAPDVDERERPGEAPRERAARLALAKARTIAPHFPGALVIGSDQVAALDGALLHKPGTLDNAREQMLASSGNTVDFFTSVAVVRLPDEQASTALDHTRVVFRELTRAEIDRYLERERPLDCAGSFKVEGAGIALFDRIETHDPAALIGLPLIALTRLLRETGLSVP